MISLDVRHPDIEKFVTMKKDLEQGDRRQCIY